MNLVYSLGPVRPAITNSSNPIAEVLTFLRGTCENTRASGLESQLCSLYAFTLKWKDYETNGDLLDESRFLGSWSCCFAACIQVEDVH